MIVFIIIVINVYCRNDIYIEVYLLLVYNGFVELFIDMLIGIMEI